jgi:hypothetical protein
MDRVVGWIRDRFDLSARSPRSAAPPAEAPRHATTASWRLPPAGRPPLPGGLSRTNLRALAARPARLEHHLTVVATIGPAQLEIATASEPVAFAHLNLSDEYALTMATGDPLIDGFAGRTFLFDPGTLEAVGRLQHRAGDLALNPYGLLHWPGQLRPPYAPPAFPPGLRRCMLMLIACASRVSPPDEDRPVFVTEGRGDAVKALSPRPVPLYLADTTCEPSRTLGAVAGATLSLLVSPSRIAPPRGGYLVVLSASAESPYFPGDLIHLPPLAEAPVAGLDRALLFASGSTPADPPPPSWSDVPAAPFPTFEEGARGALPVTVQGLTLEALSATEVTVRLDGKSATVPRYWLARTLFRAALHGFRIGYVETYGGFFYDDRGGRHRLGVRGVGEVTLAEEEMRDAVERIYRAVAPEGYTERLEP